MTGVQTGADAMVGWRRALHDLVPSESRHRERLLTAAEAAAKLGCGPAVFEALVREGLPQVAGPDAAPRFDYHDVVNVGLYSGSGQSMGELAQRALLRFAAGDPGRWVAATRWSIAVEHRCLGGGAGTWVLAEPDPARWAGRRESWEVRPSSRLGPDSRLGGEPRDDYAAAAGSVVLRGCRRRIAARTIAEVFQEAVRAIARGRPRFQWLPTAVRTDPDEAARLGVTDCAASSLTMERELRRLGFETRTAAGHVLGLVPSEHAWVEVRDDDGEWKALDPVFAALAARESRTNPAFGEFCLGSFPNRVLPWNRSAGQAVAAHRCPGGPGVETTVLSGIVRG